jgi:hypothetical protein
LALLTTQLGDIRRIRRVASRVSSLAAGRAKTNRQPLPFAEFLLTAA